MPQTPLEGAYAEGHFGDGHSSGPFGEEAPGTWMSFEETADMYLSLTRCMKRQPSISNAWFDFHGRLGEDTQQASRAEVAQAAAGV